MLRGRIVSANGIKAEDIKVPRRAPPGCCRATAASPTPTTCRRGSRAGRGRMVAAGLSGTAAGLVREARSPTGSASRSATRSWSTCSAATSRATIANLRTRRLAEPRHQFRAGVLARRLRRRAAHPHRHADLSRAAARSQQEIALLKAVARRFPGGHHGAGARMRSTRSAASSRNLVLAVRGASMRRAARRRAGARRRARRRPPPPRLRRGRAEDARRDARQADRRLCARIPAARLRHRAVRRRGRLGRGLAGRHRA